MVSFRDFIENLNDNKIHKVNKNIFLCLLVNLKCGKSNVYLATGGIIGAAL